MKYIYVYFVYFSVKEGGKKMSHFQYCQPCPWQNLMYRETLELNCINVYINVFCECDIWRILYH